MKVFMTSICAAIILAGAASVILTRAVPDSARAAFSASSARP